MYLSPFCLAYGCPMRPRAFRYRGRLNRCAFPHDMNLRRSVRPEQGAHYR
jgi:hypothetical protein